MFFCVSILDYLIHPPNWHISIVLWKSTGTLEKYGTLEKFGKVEKGHGTLEKYRGTGTLQVRYFGKVEKGHGTLEKYRGTGTRYFAKIRTAVPVLSN